MAKRRRALSNVGGKVRSTGDRALVVPLTRALDVDPRDSGDALTHGFHSYPARMHPSIAGVLLEELRVRGGTVLDPFCGSGTVLVEAMRAGWRSLGSDLNPLALRIARIKTERRKNNARQRFLGTLSELGEASLERVQSRTAVRANLPRSEIEWYAPHVLKELAGLWEEIGRVDSKADRAAFEVLFSAIVVKFSLQTSDTNETKTDKRIRKGLVTEFFVRKGRELAKRWTALEQALPQRAKQPRFLLSDARSLPNTLGGEFQCDLVLTSPPYGGTYDYVDHHARRYAWLGVDSKALRKGEIGARRDSGQGRAAAERFRQQVTAYLQAMETLLRPGGLAVLLVGDAQVGNARVAANEQFAELASSAELKFVAAVSQKRKDWRGGPPRQEHLIALAKPD